MFKLADATKNSHRQYSELLGYCRGKNHATLRTEKKRKGIRCHSSESSTYDFLVESSAISNSAVQCFSGSCGKRHQAAAKRASGILERNHRRFQEKQEDNHDIVQAMKRSQFDF